MRKNPSQSLRDRMLAIMTEYVVPVNHFNLYLVHNIPFNDIELNRDCYDWGRLEAR